MLFRFRDALSGAALVAAVLLKGAACSAAEREVRIALSFPNGVVWPYFSVATQMGYAKEEGIVLRLTSTEGSAASYKVLASKQLIRHDPAGADPQWLCTRRKNHCVVHGLSRPCFSICHAS